MYSKSNSVDEKNLPFSQVIIFVVENLIFFSEFIL